jgi:hypothetical protein
VVVLAGEAGSVRGAVDEIRQTAPGSFVETKIIICIPNKVHYQIPILSLSWIICFVIFEL